MKLSHRHPTLHSANQQTSCGSVLILLVEEPTFRISLTSSLEDKSTFSDLLEASYPFVSFCCFRVSLPK